MMGFTRIWMTNQMGSDSPALPIAVHGECWEGYGKRNDFRQVTPGTKFAEGSFVFKQKWHESIDVDNREYVTCYFCGKLVG